MDRELVLAALVAVTVGPLIAAVAALRWRSIWAPVIPAALALALLIGWALVEPEKAEPVPGWALAFALPVALVWTRAILRALRALRDPRGPAAADTVGLLWPRVRVARWFFESLDAGALAAAVEHELAHARHRDPLRIWHATMRPGGGGRTAPISQPPSSPQRSDPACHATPSRCSARAIWNCASASNGFLRRFHRQLAFRGLERCRSS